MADRGCVVLGAVGMAVQDSLVLGAAGMAERGCVVLGAVGMAVQDSLVLGAAGMADRGCVVLGGGGIAEQSAAVLGGGGITDPERVVRDSIRLMLRLTRPFRHRHGREISVRGSAGVLSRGGAAPLTSARPPGAGCRGGWPRGRPRLRCRCSR
jgi:hypothetical protein